MLICFCSVTIILVIVAVAMSLQSNNISQRNNSSVYECGLDSCGPISTPLSLRLFLLAVIFIVLDVEIALLIAIPTALNISTIIAVISSTSLSMILIVGLAHEWREGSLNWV